MTKTEQSNQLVGQLTVETSNDPHYRPVHRVRHPNFLTTFTVAKSKDGYPFYEISVSNGTLTSELHGKFTTDQLALDHLLRYLSTSKMPHQTRVKTYSERVRAAESGSNSN